MLETLRKDLAAQKSSQENGKSEDGRLVTELNQKLKSLQADHASNLNKSASQQAKAESEKQVLKSELDRQATAMTKLDQANASLTNDIARLE